MRPPLVAQEIPKNRIGNISHGVWLKELAAGIDGEAVAWQSDLEAKAKARNWLVSIVEGGIMSARQTEWFAITGVGETITKYVNVGAVTNALSPYYCIRLVP